MKNILSVLILNRNNSNDVLKLYEDLKKQTFQDFHVIIIDDNSEKTELNKLMDISEDRFRVVSYPAPWRFGNDNKWSYGLKESFKAGSKYTYTIQTDMKICSSNLLEVLVKYMESNPTCGAACPTIYNGKGEMTWGPGIEKVRMGKVYNINETFITRNFLMHLMKYIPDNLIYYGSEYYFNNWLFINGYKTVPIPGVSVTHRGGGTSSNYWNRKYYYRPRTTILIMKLFNQQDAFYKKLQYFRSECWEIYSTMSQYYKSRKYIKLFGLMFIFTKGTLAGLFTSIRFKNARF